MSASATVEKEGVRAAGRRGSRLHRCVENPGPGAAPAGQRGGFSLIEVLVAVAVLSLLMVLLTQISESILASTRLQNQQMDSVASARRALDVIASDVASAVIGPEASILVRPVQSNQPFLAMLCRRAGPSGSGGSQHRFLAVQYRYTSDNGSLYRDYGSVGFGGAPASQGLLGNATGSLTQSALPLAEGILGLAVQVYTTSGANATNVTSSITANASWAVPNSGTPNELLYNKLTVPSGWHVLVPPFAPFVAKPENTSRAIEITLAAIEPTNLGILEQTGTLSTAQGLFTAHAPDQWRNVVDQSSLPPPAKSALRILKKVMPLE